jgi:hypothetical protein
MSGNFGPWAISIKERAMSKNNVPKPSRRLRPQVVALQKASVERAAQTITRAQEQGISPKVTGVAQRFPSRVRKKGHEQ